MFNTNMSGQTYLTSGQSKLVVTSGTVRGTYDFLKLALPHYKVVYIYIKYAINMHGHRMHLQSESEKKNVYLP